MHEFAHTKNASITHARQKKFFLQEQVSAAIFSKGHKRQKGPAPFGRADRSCRPNVAEPTVPTAEADRTIYLGHSMISVGAPVGSQEPLNDLMWIRSWSLHRRQCGPKKRCHFRALFSRTGLAKPTVGLRIGRPPDRWFFLTPFFGHRFL